ncbi:MAG: hypothetical protein NTZ93_04615 [Candidatus Beckwithbacteria bacterium]|nr:hypothetical protein [Candidatus Beckwithbacteria bacterium]
MPSLPEIAKKLGVGVSDFWDVNSTVREYRNVTDSRKRLKLLAFYERPGWKNFMYRIAAKLRQEWDMPSDSLRQEIITQGFIDRNVNKWEGVDKEWQPLIWEFLGTKAKASLREVEINLHKQWEEGQPVVQGLIGGYGSQALGGTIDSLAGEMGLAGIRHDQSQAEKIARFMDPYPYLVVAGCFKAGLKLCREENIPIKTGVQWGIRFGFIKRNTFDFAREQDDNRRGEIFSWFKDKAQTDQTLGILTEELEVAWACAGAKKLA